jgi:hypothetical protein
MVCCSSKVQETTKTSKTKFKWHGIAVNVTQMLDKVGGIACRLKFKVVIELIFRGEIWVNEV